MIDSLTFPFSSKKSPSFVEIIPTLDVPVPNAACPIVADAPLVVTEVPSVQVPATVKLATRSCLSESNETTVPVCEVNESPAANVPVISFNIAFL